MAEAPPKRKPDVVWFKNRMRALGIMNKDVAEVFGIPPNKIWMMLAARRRVRPEEITIWARTLRMPGALVFKRLGFEWEQGQVPVEGVASGTGEITWRELGDDSRQLFAPYPGEGDASMRALVLDEAAGSFARGAVFYYEPYDRVGRSAFSRLAVLTRGRGRESFLAVPGAVDEGRSTLRLIDGTSKSVDQIISATPVRWIRATV